MTRPARYLLLQIRNADDPVRHQEVNCFARVLDCQVEQIEIHDLLLDAPAAHAIQRADIILLGGSGHYSAAGEGTWLERTLDVLRDLHDRSKPTFASCWGFQAMARALGGTVVHDLQRAELGTNPVELTAAGRQDAIFSGSGPAFHAHMGHEDCVVRLPDDAIHLARTNVAEYQAFRFRDRPIYCTQFHPELDRAGLLHRLRHYPEYIQKIAGMTLEEFAEICVQETPQANSLLPRFAQWVLSDCR